MKVLVVGENITSFCNRSFSPLKQCRAIFFLGSMTPGYQKYFSEYAFSGFDWDRKCSYYHDPSNDTWENFEIGKTCKPWIDGMLDIDWASMVEFKECGGTFRMMVRSRFVALERLRVPSIRSNSANRCLALLWKVGLLR